MDATAIRSGEIIMIGKWRTWSRCRAKLRVTFQTNCEWNYLAPTSRGWRRATRQIRKLMSFTSRDVTTFSKWNCRKPRLAFHISSRRFKLTRTTPWPTSDLRTHIARLRFPVICQPNFSPKRKRRRKKPSTLTTAWPKLMQCWVSPYSGTTGTGR